MAAGRRRVASPAFLFGESSEPTCQGPRPSPASRVLKEQGIGTREIAEHGDGRGCCADPGGGDAGGMLAIAKEAGIDVGEWPAGNAPQKEPPIGSGRERGKPPQVVEGSAANQARLQIYDAPAHQFFEPQSTADQATRLAQRNDGSKRSAVLVDALAIAERDVDCRIVGEPGEERGDAGRLHQVIGVVEGEQRGEREGDPAIASRGHPQRGLLREPDAVGVRRQRPSQIHR